MFEKIRSLVAARETVVSAENIKEETDFYLDLGWTSMDMVGCVMELEDLIGREIPDNELNSIQTVGDLVRLAEGRK